MAYSGTHFKIDGCTPLAALPDAAKIHFIGVCGVAMAQLAIELSNRGYQVSGSDKQFYDPMASLLKDSTVTIFKGYSEQNVPDDVSLVVIGNVVSYGHPEVAVVEEKNLPYSFFSKLLYETCIAGRHSVVCAGTHGKTTTTALCAVALSGIAADPSYFVGGKVPELSNSLHCGAGKISAVEGDEYDSAFFAKEPKFMFYHPDTFIITSLEYDHADIYSSLGEIQQKFEREIGLLSAEQQVVVCAETELLKNLVEKWRDSADCKVYTYGTSDSLDSFILSRENTQDGQRLLLSICGEELELSTKLSGEHNALNILAVLTALKLAGYNPGELAKALSDFEGVRRRQDLLFDKDGVTLLEDFAHHPTAVRVTLEGLKEKYADRKIIAVFEPRTNTSRLRVFEEQYTQAFDSVDKVILAEVQGRSGEDSETLLPVSELAEKISKRGIDCISMADRDEIVTKLSADAKPGTLIVLMSNGSFDGVPQKLLNRLGKPQSP